MYKYILLHLIGLRVLRFDSFSAACAFFWTLRGFWGWGEFVYSFALIAISAFDRRMEKVTSTLSSLVQIGGDN